MYLVMQTTAVAHSSSAPGSSTNTDKSKAPVQAKQGTGMNLGPSLRFVESSQATSKGTKLSSIKDYMANLRKQHCRNTSGAPVLVAAGEVCTPNVPANEILMMSTVGFK